MFALIYALIMSLVFIGTLIWYILWYNKHITMAGLATATIFAVVWPVLMACLLIKYGVLR